LLNKILKKEIIELGKNVFVIDNDIKEMRKIKDIFIEYNKCHIYHQIYKFRDEYYLYLSSGLRKIKSGKEKIFIKK